MSETILINHTNERHDQDVISIYDMHIVQVRVAKGVIEPMTMKKRSEKGETSNKTTIDSAKLADEYNKAHSRRWSQVNSNQPQMRPNGCN